MLYLEILPLTSGDIDISHCDMEPKRSNMQCKIFLKSDFCISHLKKQDSITIKSEIYFAYECTMMEDGGE